MSKITIKKQLQTHPEHNQPLDWWLTWQKKIYRRSCGNQTAISDKSDITIKSPQTTCLSISAWKQAHDVDLVCSGLISCSPTVKFPPFFGNQLALVMLSYLQPTGITNTEIITQHMASRKKKKNMTATHRLTSSQIHMLRHTYGLTNSIHTPHTRSLSITARTMSALALQSILDSLHHLTWAHSPDSIPCSCFCQWNLLYESLFHFVYVWWKK